MAKTWTDYTMWSHSDKDRSVPQTWRLELAPGFDIVISRHTHYAPDDWLLTCHRLHMSEKKLKEKDVNAAKQEAIQVIVKLVHELSHALNAAVGSK